MKKFFLRLLIVAFIYLFFHGLIQDQWSSSVSNDQSTNAAEMKQIIIEEAKAYQIPKWIPLMIAEHESRFNPRAVGDNGTSFGLFQLHRGNGLAPANLSDEELKDPRINTQIAMPHLAKGYKRGLQKGLSGLELLKYTANTSGWPGTLGVEWTDQHMNYNAGLETFYKQNQSFVSH